MVIYAFEGRLATRTLGMLLTRRLDRAGLKPLRFVATDYSLAHLGARPTWARRSGAGAVARAALRRGYAGDDLEAWLNESSS